MKYRPEEYCSSSSLFGISGSPSCPSTSISATVHCLPLGSVPSSRSRYFQSSMLHRGIFVFARSFQQLIERSCNLRSGERFRDQQDSSGFSRAQTRVGLFGRVTDDDNGKLDRKSVV